MFIWQKYPPDKRPHDISVESFWVQWIMCIELLSGYLFWVGGVDPPPSLLNQPRIRFMIRWIISALCLGALCATNSAMAAKALSLILGSPPALR